MRTMALLVLVSVAINNFGFAQACEIVQRKLEVVNTKFEAMVASADEVGGSEHGKEVMNADEEQQKKGVSADLKLDVINKSVGRYSGEVLNGWISHQTFTLTHNSSGIYSQAVSYVNDDGLVEGDILLGGAFELNGFSFDGGVGYYAIKDGEDWLAWYFQATFPEVVGIVPTAYVEANYGVDGGRGGIMWIFGGAKKFSFFEREYTGSLEIGGNDGIYGYKPELVAFVRLILSTDFELPGKIKMSPLIAIQKGFSEEGISGDGFAVCAGLSLNISLF